VLCLVYFMFAFYPAASASSDLASARHRFYAPWRDRYELKWRNELEVANSAARRIDAARRAEGILKETILNRLEAAVENDPHNAALLAELAYWQGKCWLLFAEIGKIPNEEHANAMRGLQQLYGEAATKTAAQAIELDPHGREGYQVMVLLRKQFSRPVGPQEQHRQFVLAQANLAQMVELDPNDARLRFLLAEACFRTGDLALGRASARQALDLDEQSSSGWRKLTPPQREQALKWVVDTAVR
jgi:hypothetical protein